MTTTATFTKIGSDWGIKGTGLVAGEQVTIIKRDGSTKTAYVLDIKTDHDGEQTATISNITPTTKTATTPAPKTTGGIAGARRKPRSQGGHYGTTCTMCGAREVVPGVCDEC